VCASAIFATGSTSTYGRPVGFTSTFPESLGEGSEDRLAPMAPPSVQPDPGFDFMPANGTQVMGNLMRGTPPAIASPSRTATASAFRVGMQRDMDQK
jgi:hypothetical protein